MRRSRSCKASSRNQAERLGSKRPMRRLSMYALVIAATLASATVPVSTQRVEQGVERTDEASAVFDVVSVKPNRSGDLGHSYQNVPGRFTATNIPVTTLLIMAYAVPIENVLNAPGWVFNERFDVEATYAADAPAGRGTGDGPTGSGNAAHRLRLRHLLSDRFNAVIREVPGATRGFALLVSRPDGRLGPALKPSAMTCPEAGAQPRGVTVTVKRESCGIASDDAGSLTGKGVTMAQLTAALSLRMGAPVTDRTGLEGTYDFDLKWAPNETLSPSIDSSKSPLSDRPSVSVATSEQLGLTLASEMVRRGSLYVERIDRPTAN